MPAALPLAMANLRRATAANGGEHGTHSMGDTMGQGQSGVLLPTTSQSLTLSGVISGLRISGYKGYVQVTVSYPGGYPDTQFYVPQDSIQYCIGQSITVTVG